MDQKETKHQTSSATNQQKEIEQLTESLSKIHNELSFIKTNVKKRKSEITTLKILFYTGLFVLLFGFIYTNQTLQRAQYDNLETNISALQNRINQTFISLEKKMHEEIIEMDEAESREILDEIYPLQRQPQFVYSHKWEVGDFVMWDNRCLLHARTDFPRDQRRLLRRVTISDEAAVMAS